MRKSAARTLVLIFTLFLCSAPAIGAEHFCMVRHIEDAMRLNEERKPLYAALSNGESVKVSEALIQFEKNLIWQSKFGDLVSYPFQAAGIPILCSDYISMEKTPAFANQFAQGVPQAQDFVPAPLKGIKESLEKAIDKKDYAQIVKIADTYIVTLEKEPRFNCMVRHFIESLRRVAGLAPQYQKMTDSTVASWGLRFISQKTLKGHLEFLDEAARIDKLAVPTQIKGIPILCQDVPAIPPA